MTQNFSPLEPLEIIEKIAEATGILSEVLRAKRGEEGCNERKGILELKNQTVAVLSLHYSDKEIAVAMNGRDRSTVWTMRDNHLGQMKVNKSYNIEYNKLLEYVYPLTEEQLKKVEQINNQTINEYKILKRTEIMTWMESQKGRCLTPTLIMRFENQMFKL